MCTDDQSAPEADLIDLRLRGGWEETRLRIQHLDRSSSGNTSLTNSALRWVFAMDDRMIPWSGGFRVARALRVVWVTYVSLQHPQLTD